MRCTVTKDNLTKALTAVTHLTSRTAALPILRNALLEVQPGGVTLSATNLEVGVRVQLRGKVGEVGSVTVDARILSEFVATLPAGPVELASTPAGLTVEAKGVNSVVKTLPPEEFPVIPFPQGAPSQTLPLPTLLTALGQVSYAASGDDGRPELTGILWQWSGKALTLAATDSYRLAECVVPLPKSGPEHTVILPAKLLSDLTRSLGDASGDVSVGITENQAVFTTDHAELVSRVIDGQFPEYRGILPKEHTTAVTLPTAELTRALKAAGLFVRPGVNDTTLTVGDKSLTVAAANAQVGEGSTEIPATVQGDGVSVVFNYRYLLDALTQLPTEEVRLELSGPKSAAVVRPVGDTKLTALVMPIRA